MRILIVGAGALGGYIGSQLLAGGRDVTFLVRQRRAQQLAENGLVINSHVGNIIFRSLSLARAENLQEKTFDLILMTCKSYDLPSAIADVRPAVGRNTIILPLLNGMKHLEDLDAAFGVSHVIGGVCMLSAAIDESGVIKHLGDRHSLTIGKRAGCQIDILVPLESALSTAGLEVTIVDNIHHEMWQKWMFSACSAALTTLMHATVGDIVEAGGSGIALQILDECRRIAISQGYIPTAQSLEDFKRVITERNSLTTTSMYRDMKRGRQIEADHLLGDLIRRRPSSDTQLFVLDVAYLHLRSYEAKRRRLAPMTSMPIT